LSGSSYGFDDEAQRRTRSYLYRGLDATLCKAVVLVVSAFLVLGLRLSVGFSDSLRTYVSGTFWTVAIYVLIGYLMFWLVSFPFDYYKGYALQHKFGLSTEKLRGWFRDKVTMSVLSLLIILVFVEGIYGFMQLSPTYWWLLTWVVSAFFIVFFAYVYPVLIMPLFYKYPKLEDEELLNRLSRLAAKAGIRIKGVYEMKASAKTRKATAALAGIGSTRRMILSDTFLSNSSKDEIETTMGHEIGHQVYGHIWEYTVVFSAAFLLILFLTYRIMQATAGSLGLGTVDSASSLPLMALVLGLFYAVLFPFMNTLSRWSEAHCDQYALDLVEKPDAYITKMTKLCDQNLRYAYPHPLIEYLFYDHPSGKKRIERALAYKRAHSTE
jgi:STE24 endopeptidase